MLDVRKRPISQCLATSPVVVYVYLVNAVLGDEQLDQRRCVLYGQIDVVQGLCRRLEQVVVLSQIIISPQDGRRRLSTARRNVCNSSKVILGDAEGQTMFPIAHLQVTWQDGR